MTDLTEMWEALAEYQPFADKRGFGEAWKRMCEERTDKAALDASSAAAWDAAWAAACAAYAVACAAYAVACAVGWVYPAEWAQRAIDRVREAIEQEEP